jgi:hypothetical protein
MSKIVASGRSPTGTDDAPPPREETERRLKNRKTVTDSEETSMVPSMRVASHRGPVVLRKEVIQPQVLLRLPCYDLVPIIELTFGAFPPCGLDRRLRVLPTFVA